MTDRYLKLLKYSWPSRDCDYPCLAGILVELGYKPHPDYQRNSTYLRQWAIVEAGRLLGYDVDTERSLLAAEIERLDKIKEKLDQEIAELEAWIKELESAIICNANKNK
jgi:hypothetical protein